MNTDKVVGNEELLDSEDDRFKYEPGVCNIDDKGAKSRRMIAITVAIAGLMLLVILYALNVPPLIRYIATSGFAFGVLIVSMEAKQRFCVFNGYNGSYEVDYTSIKVDDPVAREVDRKRSTKMLIQIILGSMLIGLAGLISI